MGRGHRSATRGAGAVKRDSAGTPIPGGSICPTTGKRMWSSRRQVKLTARRVNPGEHMSAYRCPACDWWHIGHMPNAVRTGDLDRAEIKSRPKGRT